MSSCRSILLGFVAVTVLSLGGNLWLWERAGVREAVPGPLPVSLGEGASLSSSWSQHRNMVLAAAEPDSDEQDSDANDSAEGKERDGEDGKFWDLAMLG